MRLVYVLLVVFASLYSAVAGEFVLQRAVGDVTVRQGMTEGWVHVGSGHVLSADATIRVGPKSSAVLVAPDKTINLPSEVIVDVSDVRDLSQEELMLKLTMERVRSSSYEWKRNELNIPNTTVVHGSEGEHGSVLSENDVNEGEFVFRGAKVLFDAGLYSTCALRALDAFRRYTPLASRFEYRWLEANALEKAGLRGEALSEYSTLAGSHHLTPAEIERAQSKIRELREGELR